jgi:hypothetical protein
MHAPMHVQHKAGMGWNLVIFASLSIDLLALPDDYTRMSYIITTISMVAQASARDDSLQTIMLKICGDHIIL